MLVSFHESYLLIVELCALMCMLTMVYSLYEHLTRGIHSRKQGRRAESLRELLNTYAESQGEEQRKKYKQFSHMLNKPEGVLALTAALDEIGWDDSGQMTPVTRRALCQLLTEKYIRVYQKDEEAVQGMLIALLARCDASSSRLKQSLLKNLEAKNLLVRIETLRYISAQRDRKLVLRALECIHRQPQYFSNKLLTDTLIEFRGNREALMQDLWANRAAYSQDIQISIIQTIAVLRDASFAEQIFALAEDQQADKETRLAALKYFQSVSKPEYVEAFAQFLTDLAWEYGAVAANVLRNYDCTGVFEQLLAGCASRNWYVRNNCAKTLVECCSEEQIEQAMHAEDRYSRDSIRYVRRMKEREVQMA